MLEIIEKLKSSYVLSLPELVELLGHKTAVYRLVESGEIAKVSPGGLGYFSLPDTEEGTAHFAIIKKYYPQCVVSGKTALSLYDLSLNYINKIDVDISNKTNLSNELLDTHRVVESKISNVIKKSFEKKGIPFEIKIYSPERVLFEAYKYYKGLDSYHYCMKQYQRLYLDKKQPGEQYNTILKINKKVGREIIDLLMMSE